MPIQKRSLWLSRELAEEVDACEPGEMSALINRCHDRYRFILRRAVPALTEPEWMLLVDALMGTISEPAELGVAALAHGVADAIALERLDAKWAVDGAALLATLRALTPAEAVAVLDAAERFWPASGSVDDYRARLREILPATAIREATDA